MVEVASKLVHSPGRSGSILGIVITGSRRNWQNGEPAQMITVSPCSKVGQQTEKGQDKQDRCVYSQAEEEAEHLCGAGQNNEG